MGQRREKLARLNIQVVLRSGKKFLGLSQACAGRLDAQGPVLFQHSEKVSRPRLSRLELVVDRAFAEDSDRVREVRYRSLIVVVCVVREYTQTLQQRGVAGRVLL